jgi:DNA-binding MarR family transcriptional regulator
VKYIDEDGAMVRTTIRDNRDDRTPPAPDPAEVLTEVVPRLYRVLRAALDEDPAVPSLEQLRVMTRIDAGIENPSALAAARQLRMSAITPLIDALEGRGWVTRGPDPGDRRRVRLALTAAGRRAMRAARGQAGTRLRDVLGHAADGGLDIDVGMVAEWLDDAVRRYDDKRLAVTASGDAAA